MLTTPDTLFPQRKRRYSLSTPTTMSTSTPATSDSHDEEVLPLQINGIDEDIILRNICRGKPFPMWLFKDMEPQDVSALPPDIDGLKFYRILMNTGNWLNAYDICALFTTYLQFSVFT